MVELCVAGVIRSDEQITAYRQTGVPSDKSGWWWGRLKVGRLYGLRFATRRQAMDEVIDWMTFYNHRRIHSTLGYVSPMQFERSWLAAQLRKAA